MYAICQRNCLVHRYHMSLLWHKMEAKIFYPNFIHFTLYDARFWSYIVNLTSLRIWHICFKQLRIPICYTAHVVLNVQVSAWWVSLVSCVIYCTIEIQNVTCFVITYCPLFCKNMIQRCQMCHKFICCQLADR